MFLSDFKLISGWNFGVFKSHKKPTKFLTDFCPNKLELILSFGKICEYSWRVIFDQRLKLYVLWMWNLEIQPFNGLYYIKLTPDINGNYKEKTGPLLSNTWKCSRNNLFATAFLHSILKRLLHFHDLFVKLLATYYIDVSIHKHLLYCLPEMRSIKVSLNIMDLIEAQIRRYRNPDFLMKVV